MVSGSAADDGKKRAGQPDWAESATAVLEEDVYAKQERLFAAEPPETPA